MDVTIHRLTLGDYDECLHFLNEVFGQSSGHTINFERELPRAFRREERLMNRHCACRMEGRIVAVVGVYPMDLMVCGQTLHCATVGNIATHPTVRGKGLMKRLMQLAMAELGERNIDLSRLGGLRQRYNRYGYERAGSIYRCRLTAKNLTECLDAGTGEGIEFRPIRADDTALLGRAFDLYRGRLVALDRTNPAELNCSLRAHYMQPWAAMDAGGRMIGYLTASEDGGRINEQGAADVSGLIDMLAAWIRRRELGEISFSLMPWDTESTIALGRICEQIDIASPCMFRVLNWDRVTGAFLTLKAKLTDIAEGEMIVGVRDWGNIRIAVSPGGAACEKTSLPADITIDQLTAMRLLFGPLPSAATAALPGRIRMLTESWFPLPLSWYPQDNV